MAVQLATEASGQVFKPRVSYRSGARASFDIFNGSANFTGTSTPETVYFPQRIGRESAGGGTASDEAFACNDSRPVVENASALAQGFVEFGSVGFAGTATAATTGGGIGCPENRYFTRKITASTWMELGFEDQLTVVSATLPAGTPVTVRFSMRSFAEKMSSLQRVVVISVPPPSGGEPAPEQILESSNTTISLWLSNDLNIRVFRAAGTFQLESGLSVRATGDLSKLIEAEVGGRIVLNYFSVSEAGCATSDGIRSAETSFKQKSNMYAEAVTAGVALQSASGANYRPAGTGMNPILQAFRANGGDTYTGMLITFPAGGVLQSATVTPTGMVWSDLPDTEVAVVPFSNTFGFFRVKTNGP